MTRSFHLPDLGEGIAEGEIIGWLVDRGDTIQEDQPLVEIETDKALVEIPSPFRGTVTELCVGEGDTVPVGSELIRIDVADGGTESAEPPQFSGEHEAQPGEDERPGFARPSTRRLARELGVDLGSVEGTGTGGRITEGDVRAASEQSSRDAPSTTRSDALADSSGRGAILATPATRRVATELGVDLTEVTASTHQNNRPVVTEADVRSFAEEPQASAGDRRESYRGVRRTVGERMEESATTIPQVTHYQLVEATRLVDLREDLEPVKEGSLSYLPFLVQIVAHALADHPRFNASLDTEAAEIRYHDSVHIGIATDTDAGLMVPVIPDVEEKSLFEIADEIRERAREARDRSIDLEYLRGGTFTITNVGVIGGDFATPLVNPPESAILACGAIKRRAWVVDGVVQPRHTLPLSLSFDHRIADGADAARFINDIKSYVQAPSRVLVH